jgi:hypothetical protein
MPKTDTSVFSSLGEMIADEEAPPQPPPSRRRRKKGWTPKLGKTQMQMFNSAAPYILSSGERATGKTHGLLHKLLRHGYENKNALCLVLVGVRSQALIGGAWEKLQLDIIPEWKEGLKIKFTEEKMNEMRMRYFYMENMHGGWSKVVLMSIPWGAQLKDRIKGIEPSFVFVDELTTLQNPDYFNVIVQQLGRRKGITGAQQYTAACNPDGPRHWVYKRFFVTPLEENTITGKAKGVWDNDYAVFHVPISENRHNLDPKYFNRVMEAVRDDPVEEARMIRGEWIDRPVGTAIFKNHYKEDLFTAKSIIPNRSLPIVVGYDLGSANNAIIFMQMIPWRDQNLWTIFDEMVYTDRRLDFETTLVPHLMQRMDWWQKQTGHTYDWTHVSDNSAFNQYRSSGGSFDVLVVERASRALKGRFPDLKPIMMEPAPKFKGSVEVRVRLMMQIISRDLLRISPRCTKIKDMLICLESEKLKGEDYNPSLPFTPRRSKHLHPFDAATYPMVTLDLKSYAGTLTQGAGKSEIIGLS